MGDSNKTKEENLRSALLDALDLCRREAQFLDAKGHAEALEIIAATLSDLQCQRRREEGV